MEEPQSVFTIHTSFLQMNPPFSNDRLRNLSVEFIRNEEEKYINALVDMIQSQILQKADADSPSSEWAQQVAPHNGNVGTYKLKMNIPMSSPNIRVHECVVRRGMNNYINQVVLRLKERFPEMKIDIDPLRTYILFDWS